LLFTILISSVHLSPTFANYLRNVPGMEALINLVGADKGLQEAITNDYIQEVGLSHTADGKTFTVDYIIFDESRMYIFYTFDIEGYEGNVDMLSIMPKLVNEQGEKISAGISYGAFSGETNIKKGRISVGNYDPKTLPDTVTLEVKLREHGGYNKEDHVLSPTWEVSFPLNKEKFFAMREERTINETVTIEGFKFNIDKAVIYPTRIAVHFSGLDQNKEKLFTFEDFHLVDETGEKWEFMSGYRSGDHEYIIYFESNFFKNRKSLTLKGSSIRALPKEDLIVAIDVKNKKLIKAPNDRLRLHDIKPSWEDENTLDFQFVVKVNENDKQDSYFLFSKALVNEDGSYKKDTEGNYLDIGPEFISAYPERKEAMSSLHIKKTIIENENIIYLKLTDYPNELIEPFSIKIK
jgi:hypothetical protein